MGDLEELDYQDLKCQCGNFTKMYIEILLLILKKLLKQKIL